MGAILPQGDEIVSRFEGESCHRREGLDEGRGGVGFVLHQVFHLLKGEADVLFLLHVTVLKEGAERASRETD